MKHKNDFEVEKEIADHLFAVMELLGIKETPSNCETPNRIAKMWNREVFANRNDRMLEPFEQSLKVFDNTEGYSGHLLVVKGIPFNSMCEHHFMPFSGTVSVGYVPRHKILGLSKIPRIVKYFSKKPQLQERYTTEIAEYIFELVEPTFVIAEVRARHSCVSCRGIELPSKTVTRNYRTSLPLTTINEDFKSFMRDFDEQVGR